MKAKEIYIKETGKKEPINQIAYHEWQIDYRKWLEKRVEKMNSDMFSAIDMRIAFQDGEHYGKGGDASFFDIENYKVKKEKPECFECPECKNLSVEYEQKGPFQVVAICNHCEYKEVFP